MTEFCFTEKYVIDVVELTELYSVTWIKIPECLLVQIH